MPRKKQISDKEKLKRDLNEMARIRELAPHSMEREEAIKHRVMRMHQLSEDDIQRRNDSYRAMGSPTYSSPEWIAELKRLKSIEHGRERTPPDNANELSKRLMLIATLQAATYSKELNEADKRTAARKLKALGGLVKLPAQNGNSDQQRKSARRLYRWLWRHFPGQLQACDSELRELIRKAGGVG